MQIRPVGLSGSQGNLSISPSASGHGNSLSRRLSKKAVACVIGQEPQLGNAPSGVSNQFYAEVIADSIFDGFPIGGRESNTPKTRRGRMELHGSQIAIRTFDGRARDAAG